MNNYENSKMELWLRKKRITTNEFSKLVGCSRQVIWKIKRNMPICPKFGQMIFSLTKGEISPQIRCQGEL